MIAGCLETVCWHLKGSAAWLDLTGVVLALEPSENWAVDVTSPSFIDAHLTDLARLGVFDQVAALVFGRPYGYPMLTLPLGARARLDAGNHEFRLLEPATLTP